MPGSSIPDAKGNLFDALTRRPALSDVHVGWGLPAKEITPRRRVYVDRAREINRDFVALGAKKLEESYILDVVIEAFSQGDDLRAAEQTFWELVTEVEATVREDLTLGGAVRESEPSMSDQELGPADDNTQLCRVTVQIRCATRI